MNIIINDRHNNLALALMAFTCFLSGFYSQYYMVAFPMSLGAVMFAVNRVWGDSGPVYATRRWRRNDTRQLLWKYSGVVQIAGSRRGYGTWLLIVALVMLELFAAELTKLVLPRYLIILGRYGGVISLYRPYQPALWLLLIMAAAEEIGWRAYFQDMMIKRLDERAALGVLISSMLLSTAFLPLRSSITTMPIDVIIWDYLFILTGNILLGTLFYRTKSLNAVIFAHMAAIVIPYIDIKILMMR